MTKTDSSLLGQYYYLTKPGIIRGNLLTAVGGFFLASNGSVRWSQLTWLLIGMSLTIAGSCVFNNIYDKDIDAKMPRTTKRATVTGAISNRAALIYASFLSLGGVTILLLGTNILTTVLGILGLLTYVAVYTPAKHRTPYATLLGTFPGALPPVAGYTAVTGQLDLACVLLFIILVCWQMPHFYAIAIRRMDQYKAAGVPVWPAVCSIEATQQQMITYTFAFIISVVSLSVFGPASWLFATVLGLIGTYWLYACIRGRHTTQPEQWAKTIFLLSLPILPIFSLLLALNPWLT